MEWITLLLSVQWHTCIWMIKVGYESQLSGTAASVYIIPVVPSLPYFAWIECNNLLSYVTTIVEIVFIESSSNYNTSDIDSLSVPQILSILFLLSVHVRWKWIFVSEIWKINCAPVEIGITLFWHDLNSEMNKYCLQHFSIHDLCVFQSLYEYRPDC